MKKIFFFLFIIGSLSWGTLEASSSGKNLLNPALFTLNNHVLSNTTPIEVEGGSAYTLSLPEYYAIDLVHVKVEGSSGTVYIDEVINTYYQCILDEYYTACTFMTAPSETGLIITFSQGYITSWYQYYQMYDFQLEKNQVRTPYEPYQTGSSGPNGPLMQGSGILTVSYARNAPIRELINENIQAHDNIDGDITHKIQVWDDFYSGNENITGRYTVLLRVADTAGNVTMFELVIEVIDNIPPVISGPSNIDVQIDAKPAINDLIANHFTFNDTYSGTISTFTVTQDQYTEATGVGSYPVTVRIEDLAGNRTERTFNVNIRSDLPPVMQGPDSVRLYLSENPNATHVTQLFTANDRANGEALSIDLKSTTITDWSQSGRFRGTLSVTDSFDNTSTRQINIIIVDDIPPIFTYDNQIIIPLGTALKESDLMQMVINYYHEQGVDVKSLRVIDNGYEGNEFEEGLYPFSVEVLSFSGDSFVHQGRISVEAIEDDPMQDWPLKTMGLSALMTSLGLAWIYLRRR